MLPHVGSNPEARAQALFEVKASGRQSEIIDLRSSSGGCYGAQPGRKWSVAAGAPTLRQSLIVIGSPKIMAAAPAACLVETAIVQKQLAPA
jgi:hypothetical protein